MYSLFIFEQGSDNVTPDKMYKDICLSELLQNLVTAAKGGDHTFVINQKDGKPFSIK